MSLKRIIDAEMEPVSLGEVKNQLRVTTDADNDAFRLFIASVRHKVEWHLNKTLISTTWEYKLDSFADEICLPMGPVKSISSISYVDTDGANQSFTDFQFDEAGRLSPAYGFEWPSTRDQYDAVTVTYVAGETNAGLVPEDIKLAILLWVGACDVGREDSVIGPGIVVSTIPNGAESLLFPHRKVAA